MAKVYVSSTRLDLEPERTAVIEWLIQADHQPAHSYVADTHTVREGCLKDVRECDAYVLILGHRYGHVPNDVNPEGRSITELEYGEALAAGLPIVVLQPKGVRDISVTDLGKPAYAKVTAFTDRVNETHKAFQFLDEAELIAGLSSGLQKALRGDPLTDPAVQRVIARLAKQGTDKDQRIETLERENARLQQELAAAIAHTFHAAAQPAATALERAAAVALEAGDTKPAEALLRDSEEAAEQRAQATPDDATARIERRRAAQFARERGALAMQTDVASALAAYQQATEYEPEDLWSWFFLGDLFIANGNLSEAEAAYRSAQKDAQRRSQQPDAADDALRDLSVSQNRIGDVLVVQGDRPGALAAYRTALAIGEALVARDPANPEWRRELSVSHVKVGEVLAAQGDQPGALAAYRKSLAIDEALAATDPSNAQWQRDLSVSHIKIGDVLVSQGDQPGALASYRKSFDIAKALAERNSANTKWQRDLSVIHDRIGNVLMTQGEPTRTLAVYRDSLAIRETLVARDPGNTQWQRDLSVSHTKIGDVLVVQGDQPGALAAYRTSLTIREALAARDPSNTEWQRDLWLSHYKLGEWLLKSGERVEARSRFRKSDEIIERLAASDPTNVQWQLDVADQLAQLSRCAATATERTDCLQRSRAIMERLAERGQLPAYLDWIPQGVNWRDWFSEQLAAADDQA